MVNRGRQCPLHAEAGHRRESLCARVGRGQADRAVGAQLVADRNDHVLQARELVLVGHDNAAGSLLDAGVHAARVGTRRRPARAIESVAAPTVVVRERTEGGQARRAQHHGRLAALPLNDAARRARQQRLVVALAHADVPAAHREGGPARRRGVGHLGTRVDRLPDGHDMSGLAPGRIGGQDERGLQNDLALRVGQEVARPTHGHGAYLAGGSHGLVRLLPRDLAISEDPGADTQIGGRGGQRHRGHRDPIRARGERHGGVEGLDGLRLGLRRTIRKQDAVAGELPVARAFAEVAAVGQELPTRRGRGLVVQGLIDEVPNETASVGGVTLQGRVELQAAHRVTHRVHVLARQVGLLGSRTQVLLNRVGQRVHARLDIGGVVELAIPGHALVVDRARRIQLARAAVHRAEHLTAIRFVAQRPDQHARVVTILEHHRLHAIHARALPLHLRTRNRRLGRRNVARRAPRAVGLQVRLVDDVQAKLVAQIQETRVVGVVARTNRVDVELLAHLNVRDHGLQRHRAARARIELVTVGSAEDQAAPVEHEDTIDNLEATESHALAHALHTHPVGAAQLEGQRVQSRRLRTPRGHIRQVGSQLQALRARGPLGAPCDLPVRVRQLGGHGQALAGPRDGGRDAQVARAARVVVVGAHLEVLHVGRGQRHQADRAEQAVESPGVLALQPGGAGVLVAHDDDVVLLPVVGQGTRDVELAGRVAVLAVADERAVHPDVQGRREAVEARSHAAARVQGLRHGLVQCEGTTVDSDAAVRGSSRGLRVLVPIPWHLDVDVSRGPQSLGFKRGGDGHCMHVPLSERTGGVLQRHALARGQCHLPDSVEALAGRCGAVRGAGAQSIDSEGLRIVEPGRVGRVDKSGVGHGDLRTCDVAYGANLLCNQGNRLFR